MHRQNQNNFPGNQETAQPNKTKHSLKRKKQISSQCNPQFDSKHVIKVITQMFRKNLGFIIADIIEPHTARALSSGPPRQIGRAHV